MAERKAHATWRGSLADGEGSVNLASGATSPMPMSWKARTEGSETVTSPEELIAAAYASCFAMALSHTLTGEGHQPEELDVNATCTFGKVGEGFAITKVQASVQGKVPGIDEAAFQEAVEGASKNCPVSKALAGNVEIEAEGSLV